MSTFLQALKGIDKQVHPQVLAGIEQLRRNRPLAERQHHPDSKWGENAIRLIALGKKNWLFAGSERAGKRAAARMILDRTVPRLKARSQPLQLWHPEIERRKD